MSYIGTSINQTLVTVTPTGTPTFDFSLGNNQQMTTNANVTGITLSNPVTGAKYTIALKYAGAHTVTSAADKMDLFILFWDGTNYYVDSCLAFATT
jgi:hypothetical protein